MRRFRAKTTRIFPTPVFNAQVEVHNAHDEGHTALEFLMPVGLQKVENDGLTRC